MSSNDYFEFYKIKSLQNLLEPNLNRYQIQKGLFGSIYGKNLWTHKDILPNHIKIFPLDKSPESNIDPGWSINIKISDFEKMMNLKAFW